MRRFAEKSCFFGVAQAAPDVFDSGGRGVWRGISLRPAEQGLASASGEAPETGILPPHAW